MSAHVQSSPLRQALVSTGVLAVLGVIIRFAWGAIDPEMRTWSFVAVAPWGGLYTYLYASKRLAAIATILILLGIGGFIFFAVVLLNGTMPAAREDVPYVISVFAFPTLALGLGLYQLRKARRVS